MLRYFEREKPGAAALGMVSLAGSTVERVDGLVGKRFCFRVGGGANVKQFDFQCDTESDVRGWIEAIGMCLDEWEEEKARKAEESAKATSMSRRADDDSALRGSVSGAEMLNDFMDPDSQSQLRCPARRQLSGRAWVGRARAC